MNKQVESILQAALLDKQELQLNLKRLHLNQIVENAFSYFKIILEQQNGTADIQLKASNDSILGDEVHITNLVRNLLDNAIKYCKPDTAPHLRISTVNTKSHIQLFVEDNGIGMSKETTTRIFEKFYRAHTGNVHNVKGFGLGLTYVKAIVDAHKGKIKVDSVFGKGSVFTIELPISVV
jgi:two-component system phosphate regulon sensor histidine kinase PhoR